MSRHGECTEIVVLEKKVADIDGIDNPTAFIGVMRQRGYNVTERAMPEVGGDAVQVDVAEKGLFLLFVRARLCQEIEQGKGNFDTVWTVTMTPINGFERTADRSVAHTRIGSGGAAAQSKR